jgi:hypothetical protein
VIKIMFIKCAKRIQNGKSSKTISDHYLYYYHVFQSITIQKYMLSNVMHSQCHLILARICPASFSPSAISFFMR